ncbi:molybdopterin synthase subunit MoaD [Methanococcoides vulcani]|uniref:Molybdopterin synthase subunit MoaD n=2 Tax=Methanococcoides vulcani TaxID=1353158 RepID=A0A1H9Y4J7_9EURY|nr:ubiquitin-like small modifier protein 1 [Methanococcoides vulcani]SES63623.1 molybdopterin synthase subunit MoaD [Methanococcoides vulcani]
MVMAKIKLFANLRESAGESEMEMQGENVQEILDGLLTRFPQLQELIFNDVEGNRELRSYINILINGNNILHLEGLDTIVNDDDEIAIFPPVSGG